jgi:rhodanese-related sulfurtransferase
MKFLWWLPFGRVPEMDALKLYALLQAGDEPQLIDVRTAMEWRDSRISGTVNAPITELKSRLESLKLNKSRPVIAICRSAHRSIPAVRLLRARGFEAFQLKQGMQAWWQEKLPVVSDNDSAN